MYEGHRYVINRRGKHKGYFGDAATENVQVTNNTKRQHKKRQH